MGEILWIGVVDVCTCCALSAGIHQINVREEKSFFFFCDARGNMTAEITLNDTSTLIIHSKCIIATNARRLSCHHDVAR